MPMLTKQQIHKCLNDYYIQHCGKRENDMWYEQPAVNVKVFAREGKIITLHCHVLTGKVKEYTEDIIKAK